MEIIGVRTDEFTEAEISEIPNDRRAAAISVQSCIKGDVASVVDVARILNGTENGWRLAMRRASALASVSDEAQRAWKPPIISAGSCEPQMNGRKMRSFGN